MALGLERELWEEWSRDRTASRMGFCRRPGVYILGSVYSVPN